MARNAPGPAEDLAARCAAAREGMARGGRLLHDEVGPLLSAAGFKLALLKSDHPAADRDLSEVIDLLDKTMEHVRHVSQEMNPSPAARIGLKAALLALARPESKVAVSFKASAQVPLTIVPVIYETVTAAVDAALNARASRIRVVATGASSLLIRITDNGRPSGRTRTLAAATILARVTGISLDIATKRDTIVSIGYGMRRVTRR